MVYSVGAMHIYVEQHAHGSQQSPLIRLLAELFNNTHRLFIEYICSCRCCSEQHITQVCCQPSGETRIDRQRRRICTWRVPEVVPIGRCAHLCQCTQSEWDIRAQYSGSVSHLPTPSTSLSYPTTGCPTHTLFAQCVRQSCGERLVADRAELFAKTRTRRR